MQSINPTILWEGRRQEGEETGRGTRPGQRDGVGQAIQSINQSINQQSIKLLPWGGEEETGGKREGRRIRTRRKGRGAVNLFLLLLFGFCRCVACVAVCFLLLCGFCCCVFFVAVFCLSLCGLCSCGFCCFVNFVPVWLVLLYGICCCAFGIASKSLWYSQFGHLPTCSSCC